MKKERREHLKLKREKVKKKERKKKVAVQPHAWSALMRQVMHASRTKLQRFTNI